MASVVEAQTRADQEYWRQEVISRVRQHRARRRRRFDASMSLELDFPTEAASETAPAVVDSPLGPAPPQNQAEAVPDTDQFLRGARPSASKIIRFPRHTAGPRLAVDVELAEPVRETPRILDIPEEAPEALQMELLPSFADIRFDEDEDEDGDKNKAGAAANLKAGFKASRQAAASFFGTNAALELPPQPAGLQLRFLAGLLDAGVLFGAGGLFAMIFSRLAGTAPVTRPALLCVLGSAALLWVLFQYLFLVYGHRTPGMWATGLELCDFDGRPATVNARRWRALAAALSGLSLGLGFAWALVDEDTLGWHDRISGTYLRSN